MNTRLALAVPLLALVVACGGQQPQESDPTRTPAPSATGAFGDEEATASCVESYSPGAVAGRAFAFDGTVLSVGPSVSDRGDDADLDLPGVTFDVHEWFVGEGPDRFTVDLAGAEPGTRLLVSGEERWGGGALAQPIAWGCGFTRYHDEQTADAWRAATEAAREKGGPAGVPPPARDLPCPASYGGKEASGALPLDPQRRRALADLLDRVPRSAFAVCAYGSSSPEIGVDGPLSLLVVDAEGNELLAVDAAVPEMWARLAEAR